MGIVYCLNNNRSTQTEYAIDSFSDYGSSSNEITQNLKTFDMLPNKDLIIYCIMFAVVTFH